LTVALCLSLLLNVFFIGGAFWARMHLPHPLMAPAQRIEEVARQLELTPDQRIAFDRFIRTLRMRTRHLRELNESLFADTWSEYAKAQPDPAVIEQAIEESGKNRHAYQIEISQAMRTFLASLNDEQRARFVEQIRDRTNRDVPPLLRQLVQ
jgi:uncharacterized membrane protein